VIAQLLNREFVLQQMQDIRHELAAETPTDARFPEADHDDYQEALAAVDNAIAREEVASSGQQVPGVVSDRRGGDQSAPIDDFAFISHDPIVSLFQSAMDEYFSRGVGGDTVEKTEPADDRRGPGEEPAVTDQQLPGVEPRRDDGRRVFDAFSVTDPRWISSVLAMGIRKFRKRRAFNAAPPQTRALSDTARLILVGDWGSGVPRAQKVADQMRVSIDRALEKGREVHVIHLGDVYYSGFESEYEKRFLKHWPVRLDEADKPFLWISGIK